MRTRIVVLVALVAGVLVLGLVACGGDSDDGGSGAASTAASGTATAQTGEDRYEDALGDAVTAVADLGRAVASGDSSSQVADSIRSALSEYEAAISDAEQADLSNATLAEQRDALVASAPSFEDAWNAVADEWSGSVTNGALELVQQASAISDGGEALADAVAGAAKVAGGEAADQLEQEESELNSTLKGILSGS